MPIRILIADDSGIVRKALRALIESNENLRVCGEAVDGREGVTKARDLRPDLILLDFSMPRLNGIEAAREIGKILPTIPMVLYTMFLTPELAEEASEAGFAASVSKESSTDLMRAIDSLVGSENIRYSPISDALMS